MSENIINRKKILGLGIALGVSFIIVFVLIFLPFFEGGKNSLNYLDDLYNSISKDSAHYIPKIKKDMEKWNGNQISLKIALKDDSQAKEVEPLLKAASVETKLAGKEIDLKGDLGKIFAVCLDDSESLFQNQDSKLRDKYKYDGKKVLFNWHGTLKSLEKSLNDGKKFEEAKASRLVMEKAVECAYNYFKVIPEPISNKAGIVLFSLVFYVIYTLWYGFAIMYIFEGLGLNIGH